MQKIKAFPSKQRRKGRIEKKQRQNRQKSTPKLRAGGGETKKLSKRGYLKKIHVCP